MITVEFTYQQMLDKIATKQMFSWSRWGDGEWNAVYRDRKSNKNCDGHFYYDDMGQALLKVLQSGEIDYYTGLQNLAYRQRGKQIDEITEQYNLSWCKSDFLHYANIKGTINLFFEALESREVLLVGPSHLYPLAMEQGWYMIQIPGKNCWLEVDGIRQDINSMITQKEWCVLYAASMMSNVLIHDFRNKATQIDVGSVLDPHVGVKSRSYHHKL